MKALGRPRLENDWDYVKKKREGEEAKSDCVSGRWQAGSLAKPTTFVHGSTLRAAPPSPCEPYVCVVIGPAAMAIVVVTVALIGEEIWDTIGARIHRAPLGFRKKGGTPFHPGPINSSF